MLGFQLEILLHHGRMGVEIFYCTHGVMSGSLILNGGVMVFIFVVIT